MNEIFVSFQEPQYSTNAFLETVRTNIVAVLHTDISTISGESISLARMQYIGVLTTTINF